MFQSPGLAILADMSASALMITMIAIAIQHPGDGKVDVTTKISVATGFLAVTNIVFAYGRFLCPWGARPIYPTSY